MKKLLLLITLIYTTSIFGQIINIESKRMGVTDEGWNGNIDFNLKYTQNTNKIWQFGNKAAFQYKKLKNTVLFLTDLKVIRKNNDDLINKGYAHIRYNHHFKDSSAFAFEAFSQVQYNGVQKIKVRILNGGGIRTKVIGNDTINLNVGIAGMYEYEESTLLTYQNNFRASTYLSFNWDISEKVRFKTINYFQPLFNDFTDYRLSNESSLSLGITEKLSYNIAFSLLYDTEPVEGVPNTITSVANGLRFKF